MIQFPHCRVLQEARREERRERIRQELLARRVSEMEWLDDEPPLPSEPTAFLCGSAPKIDCMRLRAERGEAVFHPMDEIRVVIRDGRI